MKSRILVKRSFIALAFFFILLSNNISAANYKNTLVGNENGLFVLSNLSEMHLWKESSVKKIVSANGWYFLTDNGVLYSSDLSSFEYRNNGLPQNIIKQYDGKTVTFSKKTQQLKDLEVNPSNPDILVTLTCDHVYITFNGGLDWQSLGFSAVSNGAKAVAVCNIPNESGSTDLTVFLSHSIYGLSYKQPQKETVWHDIITGFDNMTTVAYPDEISDILTTAEGEVYVAQSFLPHLYKINSNLRSATMIAKGTEPTETWDGLTFLNNNILFMTPAGLKLYSQENKNLSTTFDKNLVDGFSRVQNMSTIPKCAWFPPSITRTEKGLSLSELWMTRPKEINSDYNSKIDNHHSVFIPPTQVSDQAGIDRYLNIIKQNNLDSLVINMKDDYGSLRYKSLDSEILEKGYISSYAIDLDKFIPAFKKENIYLIARIVVFKDKNLWQYQNGKYAVKDSKTGTRWQGLKGYKTIETTNTSLNDSKQPTTETVPNLYDEHWVDPYSEEVWEYNIAIAKELISRGFDEIQFDYIRFPTDGINLSNAQYTWRDEGMSKEDALISFLSYARENIDAPIGIDIYGANGWYRTGARTGQDVELLSSYVDVICPMFYPSHFEQSFLAYKPAIERPYRIYYYGTYRNSVIARNESLIRPWIQAFYLNCSYDKQYYDDKGDYVRREMFGVMHSTQNGYMFWNNSGRYTDLTPVPTPEEPYPWESFEANPKYRKPIL